jgi:hypothetical protein
MPIDSDPTSVCNDKNHDGNARIPHPQALFSQISSIACEPLILMTSRARSRVGSTLAVRFGRLISHDLVGVLASLKLSYRPLHVVFSLEKGLWIPLAATDVEEITAVNMDSSG